MNKILIYTDYITDNNIKTLSNNNIDVVIRPEADKWNITDTVGIITDPMIRLVVLNTIDTISIMEIALAQFMCKPILVTTKTIENYKNVYNCINFYDNNCKLNVDNNSFLSWFYNWKVNHNVKTIS